MYVHILALMHHRVMPAPLCCKAVPAQAVQLYFDPRNQLAPLLNAGYCQLTCGQCGCSKTITQVLQQLQANTFLQAAQATGMQAQFDLPGFTATVLAPSDAAFTTYLNGTPLWQHLQLKDCAAQYQLHAAASILLCPKRCRAYSD